eukprot:7560010-Heterocapsa_arctica.AAC.1
MADARLPVEAAGGLGSICRDRPGGSPALAQAGLPPAPAAVAARALLRLPVWGAHLEAAAQQ